MDISKLTFAVFTIADSGHCFAGYHDPSISWNGWATPTFPQHEVERMRVLWGEDPDEEGGLADAIADCKMPPDSPYLPVGSHAWTWEVEELAAERSYFLQPIRTMQQAEAFIMRLERDGLTWHFDDAPDTIINGTTRTPLFTNAEAAAATCRVDELFEVMGDPFALPVALSTTVDGKVFRLQWLQPNGAGFDPEEDADYLILDSLTDSMALDATDVAMADALVITESVMLATKDERPFQLTRLI